MWKRIEVGPSPHSEEKTEIIPSDGRTEVLSTHAGRFRRKKPDVTVQLVGENTGFVSYKRDIFVGDIYGERQVFHIFPEQEKGNNKETHAGLVRQDIWVEENGVKRGIIWVDEKSDRPEPLLSQPFENIHFVEDLPQKAGNSSHC